ncbi:MAG: hypothetical protein ACOZEN_02365 [Thermodesulfobacteriota bacterium]
MKGVTREWAITFGFSVLTLLALGLGLTWVNIERVDMAYELKRLQTEIDAQDALISKLEVERNTLMTPERLRVLAAQYGLAQARPGQIRRLSASGQELPSPVIKSVPVPEKPQKKAEAPKESKGSAKSGSGKEKKAEAKAERKTQDKTEAGEGAKSSGKSAKRTPVPFVPGTAKDSPRVENGDGRTSKGQS